MAFDDRQAQDTFAKWEAAVRYAEKDTRYKNWLIQCDKIVRRYRDERARSTAEFGRRRYNVLWANVQTLGPAIYGKMPKPIAERRFLDRDPAARLASLILERTLAFQMEIGGFNRSAEKSITDYLLSGMGVLWLRYYPEFEAQQVADANEGVEADEQADSPEEQVEDGDGEVYDKLSYERVCWDYVYYRDLLWSPGRTWDETPWIRRRSWIDKSQATEQFGKEIADRMTFGDPKNSDSATQQSATGEPIQLGKSKKAEIWEIWNKPERKIYFIAPETPGIVLKESDDPLKLEGFWPCPEPLFATQTNDTIVPVPDFVEYQDQASELDTLTNRISMITVAIRANGVYDSQFPDVARLLQDGQDNKLVPVDQWAAFAEKGGMAGAMSLVPMAELVQVLNELYAARDHVKQDLYEITGMSDILRGATDPNETASAQRIKANYATGRLGARQEAVAEFCRRSIRIAAEIIAEIFSPESLLQMSGVDVMNREAVQQAVEAVEPPPKPQPPQAPQPQAPGAPLGAMQPPSAPPDPMQMRLAMQQWQMQFDRMKQAAAQAKQKELDAQFQAAVQILRSDKLRGFRVDIETDSTIADDMQQDKSQAVELITGTLQSLEASSPVIQAAPEMAKPLGMMLMWAFRRFRVGRTLEAALEDALDQIDARIEAQKNSPPQPSPDMIKAQADMQVAQAKAGEANASAQAEAARAQADIQVQKIQFASEQQQAQLTQQIESLKVQLEARQGAEQTLTDRQKSFLDYLKAVRVAEIAAGVKTNESQVDAQIQSMLGLAGIQNEQVMQARDHAHQQQMAEAAARQAAQQPASNGAA